MTSWLIDTSAYGRLRRSTDVSTWGDRIDRGLVRVCSVTALEIGYSTRDVEMLRGEHAGPPLSLMPVEYLRPQIEDRAIEVQIALAEQGHHRAASVADLLVTATAEMAGLTVLHVDRDFELIAEVTGQPVERLAGDW